jgi:hypothetical protein
MIMTGNPNEPERIQSKYRSPQQIKAPQSPQQISPSAAESTTNKFKCRSPQQIGPNAADSTTNQSKCRRVHNKSVQVPQSTQQIPYGLEWDRPRFSTLTAQELPDGASARTQFSAAGRRIL